MKTGIASSLSQNFQHEKLKENMEWGRDARSAPTTPSNQMPNIDRQNIDPQILKAAEGFEAMFMNFMMKTMRKTVPKSEHSMRSHATDIYQSLLDGEYAAKAAKTGGVGIADHVIDYLMRNRYNQMQGRRRIQSLEEVRAKEEEQSSGLQTPAEAPQRELKPILRNISEPKPAHNARTGGTDEGSKSIDPSDS